MKIISEKEARLIACKNRQFDEGLFPNCTDADIWDGGFTEGIKFMESKIEKIIPDFLNWILENRFDDFGRSKKSSEELFEEYKEYLNE